MDSSYISIQIAPEVINFLSGLQGNAPEVALTQDVHVSLDNPNVPYLFHHNHTLYLSSRCVTPEVIRIGTEHFGMICAQYDKIVNALIELRDAYYLLHPRLLTRPIRFKTYFIIDRMESDLVEWLKQIPAPKILNIAIRVGTNYKELSFSKPTTSGQRWYFGHWELILPDTIRDKPFAIPPSNRYFGSIVEHIVQINRALKHIKTMFATRLAPEYKKASDDVFCVDI